MGGFYNFTWLAEKPIESEIRRTCHFCGVYDRPLLFVHVRVSWSPPLAGRRAASITSPIPVASSSHVRRVTLFVDRAEPSAATGFSRDPERLVGARATANHIDRGGISSSMTRIVTFTSFPMEAQGKFGRRQSCPPKTPSVSQAQPAPP